MTIRINIRQLGKKRNTINAVPFVLPKKPNTVRNLITSVVMVCVAAYNEQVRKGETIIRPMTQETLKWTAIQQEDAIRSCLAAATSNWVLPQGFTM